MSEKSPELRCKLIVYGSYREGANGLYTLAITKRLKGHYKYGECNIELSGYIMASVNNAEAIAFQTTDPNKFILADIVHVSEELLKEIEEDIPTPRRFHKEVIIYDDEMYTIHLGKHITPNEQLIDKGDWVEYKDKIRYNSTESY